MDDQEAVDQAVRNGWDIHTYVREGKVAAYAMVRGTEIHFKVLEAFRYRVIFRVATQEFLRPIFDRHGFLTTRVPHGDEESRRFIERIGFKMTWEDGDYQYFMLTALPFER